MKQKPPSGVLPGEGANNRAPSPQTTVSAAQDTFWHSTYQAHGPAVLAFLASRLGRRDLAEDLLQETFVRAIRAQGNLRDVSKIRSYLFSTAHRLMLNQARRQKPLLFSEMVRDDKDTIEPASDGSRSPDETTDLHRAEQRLRAVVEAMSPALRRAFRAAVLEQKPYAEIAAEQGWTEGQVRVNVCRARKKAIAEMRDLLRLEGVPS